MRLYPNHLACTHLYTFLVAEDGIEVEMSMAADGSPKDGMKRTKLELNSSVDMEAQLRAAVEIVCQEFNIG